MKLISSINQLGANLLSNPQLLAASGFSPEFITDIQKGFVFIPTDIIVQIIEKVVASKEGVSVQNCMCENDGIWLTLKIKRFGVKAKTILSIKCCRAVMNNQMQQIDILISIGEVSGENIISKMILSATLKKRSLLNRMSEKISDNLLVVSSEVVQERCKISLDLNSMNQIQSLNKRLPFLNQTPLEILSLQDISHVAGGLKVKTKIQLG